MSEAVWGHGLIKSEQAIMDLHDAGERPDAIAHATGYKLSYVVKTIQRYSGSWAQNDAFEVMVRQGSAALARRTALTGRQFT